MRLTSAVGFLGLVSCTLVGTALVQPAPATTGLVVDLSQSVSQVAPGDSIIYMLWFTNWSGDVVHVDPMGSGFVAPVYATKTAASNDVVGFDIPDGGQAVATLTVQVNGNTPNGTVLTQTPHITANSQQQSLIVQPDHLDALVVGSSIGQPAGI